MGSGGGCVGCSSKYASMQKSAVQTATVTMAADQTAYLQCGTHLDVFPCVSCGDFQKQKHGRSIKFNFFAGN